MNILYEDKSVIVLEKPADMLSEPAEGFESVVDAARAHCGCECFLVHRLDRNTGGVMALAKTQSAAAKLSRQIQEREFVKEYLAVIKGAPELSSGVFEDLLFKDSAKNKTFIVKRERKGVKKASLSYRVLSTAESSEHGKVSLVLVRLHTGRTHQVRVQFASRKMPLLGDGKYGSRDNRCDTALWSFRLCFSHPVTDKNIDISAAPPKEYPWNLFDIGAVL